MDDSGPNLPPPYLPYPPYPPHPEEPPPGPGAPVAAKPPLDGASTAAFVVSLGGFLTVGVVWPISLVLGIVGLARTERRRGRGLAVAALVISVLGLAMLALILLAALYYGFPLWFEILAG